MPKLVAVKSNAGTSSLMRGFLKVKEKAQHWTETSDDDCTRELLKQELTQALHDFKIAKDRKQDDEAERILIERRLPLLEQYMQAFCTPYEGDPLDEERSRCKPWAQCKYRQRWADAWGYRAKNL